jgi:predicted DNA-binding antitoxin AbrB/MazE fold protein
MGKTFHAVYKGGILKPLDPIKGIKENEEVEITVSPLKRLPENILKFAGILNEAEADEMLKTVEEEFEKVNPDEWKD